MASDDVSATKKMENPQLALHAAILRGDPSFLLPDGELRFNSEPLNITGARNMHILPAATAATTFLIFRPGAGVNISGCANLTVSGLTIDYNPLPYAVGTVQFAHSNP